MRSSGNIASLPKSLYETDYYGWLREQVHALRAGDIEHIDLENVAEELDGLSQSVRRELESKLQLILAHPLKLTCQPDKKTPSWENTIDEQRVRVSRLLRENPSLKSALDEALLNAYEYAQRMAGSDMGLVPREWRRVFPEKCPWSKAEILNPSYLPKNGARNDTRNTAKSRTRS